MKKATLGIKEYFYYKSAKFVSVRHRAYIGIVCMINDFANMEELAAVFKIFGDSTRLSILSLLMNCGELCVGDIAEHLCLTQSGVSHQLALLKQSKLVQTKRDGNNIIYSIADEHVSAIIKTGMDHILESGSEQNGSGFIL